MSALFTLLVGDGTKLTRPLKLLGAMARHPLRMAEPELAARLVAPDDHRARHAVARQRDRAARHAPPSGGVRLSTEQDPERPNPTFIPVANEFAAWLAERTGGIAQSGLTEAAANIPTTAHILGGAVIGADPSARRRRCAAAGVRL